jgi:drug/metabolite transporter (DMT)-like permease
MKEAPAVRHSLGPRAALLMTLCCMIYGGGMVAIKFTNAGISPVMNAGLRSAGAAVCVALIALARGTNLFRRDGALIAGIACGLVFALEFVGLYLGLERTTAARGILFLHAAPFVAAAGEHFLVPGHRLTGMRWFGLVAAFAGLAVALVEQLLAPGGGREAATLLVGDLLCLAGGVFWGLTTVILKTTALGRTAPEKGLLYQLVTSALALPLISVAMGEAGIIALTPKVIGGFLYTVVLVVAFGYTIWFYLMRTYSAATLHAFSFLSPIFGALAGHFVLGEAIGPATLAGLGLVAIGIWLVNRPTT